MRRALMFALALLVACAPVPVAPPMDPFERWLDAGHRAEATAYHRYLTDQGAGDVVPAHALLRTSRRWQQCAHAEYAVPPRANWSRIVPTLQVVRRLADAGVIDPALARSGYRSEAMNACAGGSARSRHLDNRGIDFDLPSADRVDALCDVWRRHGAKLQIGLGFYTPTRIHVDAAGYRTWGRDHRRGTSLCIRNPGRSATAQGGPRPTTRT